MSSSLGGGGGGGILIVSTFWWILNVATEIGVDEIKLFVGTKLMLITPDDVGNDSKMCLSCDLTSISLGFSISVAITSALIWDCWNKSPSELCESSSKDKKFCSVRLSSFDTLKGTRPSLTILSIGSLACRMFFSMSSNGPGRCRIFLFNWSTKIAFSSIRYLSARLGSMWPSCVSKMCLLSNSWRFGRCWIFAFNKSPVLALSSSFFCSWIAGEVFSAKKMKIRERSSKKCGCGSYVVRFLVQLAGLRNDAPEASLLRLQRMQEKC